MSMILSGDGTVTGLAVGGLPNATIVQADLASGVAGNGPAFRAYSSASQTGIASSVATKVQLNTEVFDTNNNFDTSTYRFTPTVAGYYQANFSADLNGTNLSYAYSALYKNGSLVAYGGYSGTQTVDWKSSGSDIVYCNGSTDYLEMYAGGGVTAGTLTISANNTFTYLSVSLIRSA